VGGVFAPVENVPEPLKHNFAGFWSRRIDEKHRLEQQNIFANCFSRDDTFAYLEEGVARCGN